MGNNFLCMSVGEGEKRAGDNHIVNYTYKLFAFHQIVSVVLSENVIAKYRFIVIHWHRS